MKQSELHPYSEPPSMQLQLEGMGERGEELMNQSRQWRKEHREEFQHFCWWAEQEYARDHMPISGDAVRYYFRSVLKVKVPNAITGGLARICEKETKAKFKLGRSVMDGYV